MPELLDQTSELDHQEPQTVESLLARRQEHKDEQNEFYNFEIPEGYIAYNPSAPFKNGDDWLALVRVERREDEQETVVRAFYWDTTPGVTMQRYNGELGNDQPWEIKGQDPSVAVIGGELVVSAVQVEPDEEGPHPLRYRQKFWKGDSLDKLEEFAVGPWGMKDIRLVDMGENGVGVYTRPQKGLLPEAGPGRVGFTVINNLNELATADLVNDAPLVRGLFKDAEWGGVNHAEHLGGGVNRVWGHIARWVELPDDEVDADVSDWEGEGGATQNVKKIREYYCTVMLHDTNTGEISQLQIIASYDDFDNMPPPKNNELPFITFMAGPDYSQSSENPDEVNVVIATGDSAATSVRVKAPIAA